jgi:hypothetical protein
MKVRIASKGWETYTGPLGQGAVFENGEAELNERQVRRIGASLILVDEDGNQVGPAAITAGNRHTAAPVITPLATGEEIEAAEAVEKQKLIEEEQARKALEAAALEAARAKAAEEARSITYTRQELEAVGANDGIEGLREIAEPLGVKGRGITELVTNILNAQAKNAAK